MQEIGIVKSVDGTIAKVLVSRKGSPCENCSQDTCTIPEKGLEAEAINEIGAKVGQKVKIVMTTYTFYKGALLIYALPIVALIGGAIAGKLYLPIYINVKDSDLLAALGGFIALILSFVVIKIIMSRSNRKTEYKSVIKSIVEG